MGDAERIESAVRSFEDHLSADLEHMADWLAEGDAIRQELAARLHVLRLATDPTVAAAVADAEQRMAHNRPYEDAVSPERLVEMARAAMRS